jgi:PAS domain S-box-containing protein
MEERAFHAFSSLEGASGMTGPDLIEHRFELLVQSVVDYAIYMLDPEGNIASWNSGAQQIKGYAAEEVLGRHFSLFYTEEDRARGLPGRVLSIAASEGRYNGEAWRVRRDGSRFRAMVAIDAIRDANGTLLGFAKVTRDVTKRWEAQSKLEQSERRFRLFAEGAVDYALCMLDRDGFVQDWNEGAERIAGYRQIEIVGRSVAFLFSEEEQAAGLASLLLRQASDKGVHEDERACVKSDGSSFQAKLTIRALKDKDGVLHGFAFLMRDVSEQRATEAELESTREQLLQAQKLDALGQLTGGVAHDFNNILQAITGHLDVASLHLERGNADKAAYQIESVTRSVERATHLVRRLLAFARRQPLMPTRIDLSRHVASIAELLERTVGPRVSIRFDLTPDPLCVLCDPHQLETALVNLVINGRDAMPQGGCVRVSTRVLSAREGRHASACLMVEDEGVGMSKDMASKAFDPFFTTKPLGQGTGLGLSMVHGFVEQSHGTVALHSVPNEGTSLTLLFPLCESMEPVSAELPR